MFTLYFVYDSCNHTQSGEMKQCVATGRFIIRYLVSQYEIQIGLVNYDNDLCLSRDLKINNSFKIQYE